ncbi:hypothetical protein [Clostridium sp. MD294]|uniref:hypothetical protein n=1 Tax=Clostridium sp. MD294 TaxID=97138 RepID=UPI0002CA6598|nr:hypothetical protein [Clostridium sp. MD294]NDO46419.1 hypothetical protein [Clostridium sp. MD294]USF29151.1 hypothetical protein C820_000534 [Clostridium sp. MD294]
MDTLEKKIAQLIKLMKKEYEEVLKIENVTNDIENVLKRNDKISTEMFLNMRMEIMEAIDGIKGEIEDILTSGDEECYHFLRGLLNVDTQEQAMNTEYEDEKMLMLISLRTRNVLKSVLEKDKQMSTRILGKNSFYAKAK